MKRLVLLIVIGIITLLGVNDSLAYVIDGKLDDWGVTPGLFGNSDWEPNSGVYWTEEDQNTDYLNPGYGGQLYDAEAIYFDYNQGHAYIAIVTGFPKSGRTSGSNKFYPGDIAIDFGRNGVYEYGIKTSKYEPLYGMSGDGGDVYRVTSWGTAYEGIHEGVWGYKSDPTVIKEGNKIGSTYLEYIKGNYAGNYKWHYIIEARLPLDLFGNDPVAPEWYSPFRIHWTMTCGNDAIDLDVPPVPEPATIFLLCSGLLSLLGIIGTRRKVS